MAVNIEENGSYKKESGGPSQSLYEPFFPRLYLLDIIDISIDKVSDFFFFLEQKYTQEGLSLRQIAAQTFSSKETVRARLKAHGVKLRVRGQHHGHPTQARFGDRVIKGRLRPLKKELMIVDGIREMREEEGISLRKIAERLE